MTYWFLPIHNQLTPIIMELTKLLKITKMFKTKSLPWSLIRLWMMDQLKLLSHYPSKNSSLTPPILLEPIPNPHLLNKDTTNLKLKNKSNNNLNNNSPLSKITLDRKFPIKIWWFNSNNNKLYMNKLLSCNNNNNNLCTNRAFPWIMIPSMNTKVLMMILCLC